MKKIWFLRSLHGELVPFFIDKSCVALGWDKLAEDLSQKSTAALKKIY